MDKQQQRSSYKTITNRYTETHCSKRQRNSGNKNLYTNKNNNINEKLGVNCRGWHSEGTKIYSIA